MGQRRIDEGKLDQRAKQKPQLQSVYLVCFWLGLFSS